MDRLSKNIVLTLCYILMCACGSNSSSGRMDQPYLTIYVGGSYVDGTNNRGFYWDNSLSDVIPFGDSNKESVVSAVYVHGGHVYSAGYQNDGSYNRASYWIDSNTTPIFLGDSGSTSSTRSIIVTDDHVYTAGNTFDGLNSRACYWIDNSMIPTVLGASGQNSEAAAISISNGHIYVAGNYYDGQNYRACYWIDNNTSMITLGPIGFDSFATALAISGGSVYTSGSCMGVFQNGVYSRACYWKDKNSTPNFVEALGPSCANAIAIYDGSIYMAGWWSSQLGWWKSACYWKDADTLTILGDTILGEQYRESIANALVIVDGHIYAAGYFYDALSHKRACYWVDNSTNRYGVGMNDIDSEANGLFIK